MRSLPNGLITAVQTRRLLLGFLSLILGASYFLGVWKETSIHFTLTWMYNDLKGGDEDFIIRNIIIAAAFGVYNEGALRVATGPDHGIITAGFLWTTIVSAVIFSTMQVQDMQDQALGILPRVDTLHPLSWATIRPGGRSMFLSSSGPSFAPCIGRLEFLAGFYLWGLALSSPSASCGSETLKLIIAFVYLHNLSRIFAPFCSRWWSNDQQDRYIPVS